MAKTKPFETHVDRYEDWFNRFPAAYEAELRAVASLIPKKGLGMEVGVGTGRFAVPLGIKIGLEPAAKMGEVAKGQGIQVVAGVGECMPFLDESVDFVLMVTTVCFLDDVEKSFREAYRVLRPAGVLVIGLVDRESPLGQVYLEKKDKNPFYKDATFFSTEEIIKAMRLAGFRNFSFSQTVFHNLSDVPEDEPVRPGYGEGSFVVISGQK